MTDASIYFSIVNGSTRLEVHAASWKHATEMYAMACMQRRVPAVEIHVGKSCGSFRFELAGVEVVAFTPTAQGMAAVREGLRAGGMAA